MENTFDYDIVTNNPSVKDKYENIIFVDGGFKDVLFKVRDLVHNGAELINHPLGASIRMFFSPYRSIIIREKSEGNSEINKEYYINTIENSIENYNKQMENRNPDVVNSEDYSLIDENLLESAIGEFKRMQN
ncbi:GrdX family protein [Tissierella creatinophila]|uniref:Glycine reductase operon associated protein GrdX n=1 Tax=Tissierella creatinophila DSM 6911 TaxID=1123403 RepID=A0A1U7M8K3_TISCR|nr:GrdX family protein [Tissierella creatinophila]OLS03627.1 glycine reductase operon associated protein GrdX [Tissierella creatinophila DSM 6911]